MVAHMLHSKSFPEPMVRSIRGRPMRIQYEIRRANSNCNSPSRERTTRWSGNRKNIDKTCKTHLGFENVYINHVQENHQMDLRKKNFSRRKRHVVCTSSSRLPEWSSKECPVVTFIPKGHEDQGLAPQFLKLSKWYPSASFLESSKNIQMVSTDFSNGKTKMSKKNRWGPVLKV